MSKQKTLKQLNGVVERMTAEVAKCNHALYELKLATEIPHIAHITRKHRDRAREILVRAKVQRRKIMAS